ncbi:MAG TPA: sialidase family protein [Terriglobales bacterium]
MEASISGSVAFTRLVLRVLATIVAGFFILLMSACGGGSGPPPANPQPTPTPPTHNVALVQLSTDTFTNPTSQHATEVEAGTAAFGSTIVTAFQVGRIFEGGGADIGFATSNDGGISWSNGFLPGTTTFANGTYVAISDPAVAYDAKHGVWMISTLPIAATDSVAVSRSLDGGLGWSDPIIVNQSNNADKNWIACDNTSTSPFYGNCYVEWDNPSAGGIIWMSVSSDGGLTWGPERNTANLASGIGGQPLVQPNGTVIVPIESWTGLEMLAFSSTDGGLTWSSTTTISTISDHVVAGSLRTSPLPAAAVDGDGAVYVVWQDCRFRTGCSSNDLILSTSIDGVTWTTPMRIPIDSATSTVDHFIPGLGIDPATSGGSAHLGLTYYFYSTANCAANCALSIGFISSQDGGVTWAPPVVIAGSMSPTWLPNTFAGFMVGDYSSTAFANGAAFSIFALADPNSGTLFDEPIFTNATGFDVNRLGTLSAFDENAIPGAQPDHGPRRFYDQEHRIPILERAIEQAEH